MSHIDDVVASAMSELRVSARIPSAMEAASPLPPTSPIRRRRAADGVRGLVDRLEADVNSLGVGDERRWEATAVYKELSGSPWRSSGGFEDGLVRYVGNREHRRAISWESDGDGIPTAEELRDWREDAESSCVEARTLVEDVRREVDAALGAVRDVVGREEVRMVAESIGREMTHAAREGGAFAAREEALRYGRVLEARLVQAEGALERARGAIEEGGAATKAAKRTEELLGPLLTRVAQMEREMQNMTPRVFSALREAQSSRDRAKDVERQAQRDREAAQRQISETQREKQRYMDARADLETYHRKQDENHQELVSLRQQITELQSQHQTRLSELETELNSCRTDLESKVDQISVLEKSLADVNRKLSGAREGEKHAQSELKSLRTQHEIAQSRIKAIQKAYERVEQESKEAHEQMRSAVAQAARAEKEARASRAKTLAATVERDAATQAAVISARESTADPERIKALEHERDVALQTIDRLEQKIAQMEKDIPEGRLGPAIRGGAANWMRQLTRTADALQSAADILEKK